MVHLKEGKSRQIIAENIRTLHHEGVPHKQAVRMAMEKAGLGLKRK